MTWIDVAALGVVGVLGGWFWRDYRRKRLEKRRKFIETYTFPERVRRKVLTTYPHLKEEDADTVIEGLRHYFVIALLAEGKMVSMPSQAVDVAWHEFLLFTKAYERFCHKAFGRFFHHHPAEAMKGPKTAQEGIRRTWRIACKIEGINPDAPQKLPLLFMIDGMLNIPDGFTYALNCDSPFQTKKDHVYCASHIGCGGGACGGGCGGGCGGA